MDHTPGSWIVNTLDGRIKPITGFKNGGEATRYHATIIEDHGPPFDIVCRLDFGYGKPEDEVNARLIAAAPDLLKALDKIAYGEIQKTIGDKPMRYSHANVKELRTIAKQAIEKAR